MIDSKHYHRHKNQQEKLLKLVTSLFLYYAFVILNLNKVYIHSLDTNIRNINLNSKFVFELEGIFCQEIHKSDGFKKCRPNGFIERSRMKIFII